MTLANPLTDLSHASEGSGSTVVAHPVRPSLKLPSKLKPLFQPMRFKALYGGRGGGKSWAVAIALLRIGMSRSIRVLCTREVQASLEDSVHQLLKDTINSLGWEGYYTVTKDRITGINGTQFKFTGLSDKTAMTLKSYEGVDYVWCEEAHSITKRSWGILTPTIRRKGSEIWLTFNPDLDTDETYLRFVTNPSRDTWSCEINWRDNPWFPAVLEQDRRDCLERDPLGYPNIWEGVPKRSAEGAIYANEVDMIYSVGPRRRVMHVPHDPSLPVHRVLDMGLDTVAIIMVQVTKTATHIIDYLEDRGHQWPHYDNLMRDRQLYPYRWGKVWLPHDAKNASVNTPESSYTTLTALDWDCEEPMERQDLEEGIKLTRLLFNTCYFDNSVLAPVEPVRPFRGVWRLLECLKRYRRSINKQTRSPGAPIHDEFSHGADCYRYLGQARPMMHVDIDPGLKDFLNRKRLGV